jgi:hypothetical protein
MCHYADELTTTGAPHHDDELVAYILVVLDEDYNSVFTTIVARTDPITPSELYSQLLSFEQHTFLQVHQTSGGSSSAMAATRGRGSSGGCGYGGFTRGRSSSGSSSRPQCQACLKIGHTANNCWHHFEEDYIPEQRTVATASSTGVDPM